MILVDQGTIGPGITPRAGPLPVETPPPVLPGIETVRPYAPIAAETGGEARVFAFQKRFNDLLGQPDVLESAFGLNNDVVNAANWLARPTFKPEPGFDPLPMLKGTKYEENYLDNFVGVQSTAEARSVMARIDREEQMRATMARSGFEGFLANIAAGSLSPTMLIPVVGWARDAGIVARAATGAGLVATAVAGQEAVLQATQETRTAEDSFWAIGGSAVLGAALGAAARGISREALAGIVDRAKAGLPGTDAELNTLATKALTSGIGAEVTSAASGEGIMKGALGLEKTPLRHQDPLFRALTSPFREMRLANRALNEIPVALEDNALGIPTSPGGSVEYLSHEYDFALADTMRNMERQYVKYFYGRPDVRFAKVRSGLSELLGQAGGKISFSEFKRAVFDAMHSGDVHAIPEVEAAAKEIRTRIEDPLKNAAIEQRLFTEDVKPGDDVSHVFRVWDTKAIAADRERLTGILAQDFGERIAGLERQVAEMSAKGETAAPDLVEASRLTPPEIRALAEKSIDTILGFSPDRAILPKDLIAGPRGPLKERLLRIKTEKVKDFVVRDVAAVQRMMVRTMATDIALMKKFGSTDLASEMAKINDEAARLIAANPERSAKITAEQKVALDDLSKMVSRMRGTYGIPSNPDGLLHRALRVVLNHNLLAKLGNVVPSSIADIGKPIMNFGLNRVMRTIFHPLVNGTKTIKLSLREGKLANAALDMSNHARQMSINDIMDNYGRGNRFEKGVQWMTDRFGSFSLMDPWNQWWKSFAGTLSQTKLLQSIDRLVAGMATKKEIEYLASNSIDANMADRIHAQFAGKQQPILSQSAKSAVPVAIEDRGGGHFIVRTEEHGPGTFSGAGIMSIEVKKDGVYQGAVAVTKKERGKGYATALHEKAIEFAGERGLPFRSDVAVTPEGVRVFDALKRRGYEVTTEPNAVKIKDGGYIAGNSQNGYVFEVADKQHATAMPQSITQMVGGHGVKDGDVWWANTEAWTDQEAVRAIRAALHRDINRTIVMPGQDKPLWMSSELGRVIGQFHSFNVASVQRTIIAGLQQRDAAALNGMMFMLGLGYLSYYLKSQAGGFAISDNPADWAINAFDNSGLAGWLMDANNVSTKLTGGAASLQRIIGASEPSRYATQDVFSLFGPTASSLESVAALIGGIRRGGWTQSTTHQLRKLIPLQNLFYLRWLFNKAETGANQTFGIPARTQ